MSLSHITGYGPGNACVAGGDCLLPWDLSALIAARTAKVEGVVFRKPRRLSLAFIMSFLSQAASRRLFRFAAHSGPAGFQAASSSTTPMMTPWTRTRVLENVLQAELNNPRGAARVNRGRIRPAQTRGRRTEMGGVGEVERLKAELHIMALPGHAEPLGQE